jgi:hypothetical protein
MRPKSSQLAVRDAALGVLSGRTARKGADFGYDYNTPYGFGLDYPIQFAGDAAPVQPTQQQAVQAFHAMRNQQAQTQKRMQLLQPNAGSSINVERFVFSATTLLTLGGAVESSFTMTQNPTSSVRPKRVTFNAPCPAFAYISAITAANLNATIGGSYLDAYTLNPNGVDQELDIPLLTPAIPVVVTGVYSGFTPPGYADGQSFRLSAAFSGPASMVA